MRKELVTGLCTLALAAAAGCVTETAKNNVNTTANTDTVEIVATNTSTTPPISTTAEAPTLQPQVAPDDSEVTTTEAGGVTTETRTFKNNSRVERVEVTTTGGKRRARVYSRNNEVKDLPDNKVESALDATGDALADSAGFVVDKTKDAASATKRTGEKVIDKTADGARGAVEFTKDAASATKEGGEKVIDKTVDVSKTVGSKSKDVGEKVVDKSKSIGEKTVDVTKDGAKATGRGAKTVIKKTGEGAKTVGEKTVEGTKKVGGAIKDAVTP